MHSTVIGADVRVKEKNCTEAMKFHISQRLNLGPKIES